MPTILSQEDKRALLKQVEGRGREANAETLALAEVFASWDVNYWNEPVLLVEPSELNLKAFVADVDTPKTHADGTPYVSNSRKVFESHASQALRRAGIAYSAKFGETRDGKTVFYLTPIKAREKKTEEVEEN